MRVNMHEPPARAFAELSTEMGKSRFAASAVALNGYECSGCGCRFPETRDAERPDTRRITTTGKDSHYKENSLGTFAQREAGRKPGTRTPDSLFFDVVASCGDV
jgi:hypothetical protein